MRKKGIILIENNLDCIIPVNIAFFQGVFLRHSHQYLHEKRIQQLLPTTSPKFRVSIDRIRVGSSFTSVVMISTTFGDIEFYKEFFKDRKRFNLEGYQPILWQDFISLAIKQRQTIVNDQNSYLKTYLHFFVEGYKTTDVTMMEEEAITIDSMMEE